MFDKWQYVQKRGNKYGVRIRVPDDLREVLQKREVTRSLGTGDPQKAKVAYHKVCAEIEADFSAARESLAPSEPALLTEETAASLIEVYFREQIYQGEASAYRIVHDFNFSADVREEERKELLVEIGQDLHIARFEGERATKGIADNILRTNGFPEIAVKPVRGSNEQPRKRLMKSVFVDRNSLGYLRLLRLTYLAQVEVWERMIAILDGTEYDQSKSMFPTLSLQAPMPISQSHVSQSAYAQGTNPISIKEVFDRFWIANPPKGTEQSCRRTRKDMDASYRVLVELFDESTDANTLTKQNFRDVLAFLRRMPKQIGNKKKWANSSLVQIVEEVEAASVFEDALLSPRTVNKYIRRIAGVLKWAADEPIIMRNHAAGIFIPEDEIDDDDSREPFSVEQLNLILSSAIFQEPETHRPSIYWATLLSLFHGMRSEEIMQLRASDFQTDEDGTWFVDIHRRDGNFLKNKSSSRETPLHPFMAELGLASLISQASANDNKRLFCDVERGAEGRFTPTFSKRYSRFLTSISAKTERTSFHSFRHAFRDAARNCSISEDRVCALGGWAFGKGTQAKYGSGLSMSEKTKAIGAIEYPKVDFSKIKKISWLR